MFDIVLAKSTPARRLLVFLVTFLADHVDPFGGVVMQKNELGETVQRPGSSRSPSFQLSFFDSLANHPMSYLSAWRRH